MLIVVMLCVIMLSVVPPKIVIERVNTHANNSGIIGATSLSNDIWHNTIQHNGE
jgi:hypothetical protein